MLLNRYDTNDSEDQKALGYNLYWIDGATTSGAGDTAKANGTGKFQVDLSAYVGSEAYQDAHGQYDGKNIVVTYSATLNNEAPDAGVMNDVAVVSQNAASKDQTKVTYGGCSFTKTATGTDLAGAKFAIKNPVGKYLKQENGVWKEVANAAAFERGGDVENNAETAKFTYIGLADGTYTVEETQASERLPLHCEGHVRCDRQEWRGRALRRNRSDQLQQ